MDGIIILIGLIVLAIPVSIIVLFVGQSNLKSRLAVLERVVREQRAAVQDGPVPVAAVVPEIRAEAIPVVQVVAPEVAQPWRPGRWRPRMRRIWRHRRWLPPRPIRTGPW